MSEDVPRIDPSRSALVVMDYQPAIVARVPGSDDLLARMRDTIALARGHGMTIGYVRVAFDDADYAAVPETNKSFSVLAGGRQMHADAPETAVHEAVAPEPGDIVVRKTRVGGFSTTDLDRQLRDRGVDTLILAGISTSGVVLSTVRDAADHDYRLYVLEDGCADTDPEVHRVLTQKIFPRQAYVVSIAELPGLLP